MENLPTVQSPSGVDEAVQTLKARGNELFTTKQYRGALNIYTSIIQQYSDKAPPSSILTVKCNRGACHLELGSPGECASDCREVIAHKEHVPISPLRKAYYRLARALYTLGEFDDALEALAGFRELNKTFDSAENKLRNEVEKAKAKKEESERIQTIPIEKYEETRRKVTGEGSNSALQASSIPFKYEVRVSGEVFEFADVVSVSLCIPYPEEFATKKFLMDLVLKYRGELMRRRAWQCWNCPKPAVSMVHTPMSYLHKTSPMVVDFAQPICENKGACEREARVFMADVMQEMSNPSERHR